MKQNIPEQAESSNLIERLGGYEAAKEYCGHMTKFSFSFKTTPACTKDELEQALLEYRRQHGIFEVGDRVVRTIGSNMVFEVSGCVTGGTTYIPRDGIVTTEYVATRGLPHRRSELRHATHEEIAAGHRIGGGV